MIQLLLSQNLIKSTEFQFLKSLVSLSFLYQNEIFDQNYNGLINFDNLPSLATNLAVTLTASDNDAIESPVDPKVSFNAGESATSIPLTNERIFSVRFFAVIATDVIIVLKLIASSSSWLL